jgi:hypothetical protein
MPLMSMKEVRVRPERTRRYERLIARLAKRARQKNEKWRWETHESAFGPLGTMYFVTAYASYQELAAFGDFEDLAVRVEGEKEAERMLEEVGQCLDAQQLRIALDRPDLSYPPEPIGGIAPATLLMVAQARPGRQEGVEELLRRFAEAIPKTDDPARVMVFQTVIGDISEYTMVRPLEGIGDLDHQNLMPALLNRAYGMAEGGLIYRSGLDAVEHMERSVVVYRGDLSNPATAE